MNKEESNIVESSESSCCVVGRSSANEMKSKTIETYGNKAQVQDMILLDGGTFLMGTEDDVGFAADGEGPIREVSLESFFIDDHPVTNREFQVFVNDTGYKTDAEKFGWSFVFHLFLNSKVKERSQSVAEVPWWRKIDGAYWLKPEGPYSNLYGRWDHPVTHVSWNDAQIFSAWSGKRLPTEAEWEFAARGGLRQKRYAWGDDLEPEGEHRCNIWQGDFPDYNSEGDGFKGTSPVKTYKPNGYDLYDVAGNVWEWTADWFSPDFHVQAVSSQGLRNPVGPESGHARVIKGGSYLCHESYCNRYRVAARSSNTPDSSTGNMGFRCAADVTKI